VTMRDEQNKTDKRLTFNFGSHNSADVEALSNGSVATIVGQVHKVRPVLNPGRLLEPVSDCWPR
ncbi:OB-fold protein, partial [Klebsiella pneumoniae]|uniref:OB-fold protein n=1 Tax=Klebsiella pneumoniae TaxID=573 RepID=UPI003B04A639|nr:hypothetical protein [Klebsiella pneumoniae]